MESLEFFWMDGWVEEKYLKMSHNRSFLFGDGFFESMRWSGEKTCFLWDYHWKRLQKTINALAFPWPENLDEITFITLIKDKIPDNSIHDWRVKLIFWRQGEGRYQPENCRLAIFFQIDQCHTPWIQRIDSVDIAESIFIPRHPLSWIKSTSCMTYVAAGRERKQKAVDDLILKNEQGFVIEGSYSCVFWSRNNTIFYPDPALGGLDSCMNRFLLGFWKTRGWNVRQERVQWKSIPKELDWIAFGSGMGIRILPLHTQPNLPELFPATWFRQ